MPHRIFFSWQNDVAKPVGQTMIETCLERAIKEIKADASIDLADRNLALDKDTLDVPGSPPIMETIFGKIELAAVFLSDLTYVGARADGRKMPNPNVMIEHGWGLRALTWRRVISVMNTAMGHPNDHELPFDLQHIRRPMLYDCPEGANADVRKQARDDLTKKLTVALKAIFSDETLLALMRPPRPAEPHPHDVALLEKVHHLLSVDLRQFLHLHNFGNPFRFATLHPFYEMNEWVGAGYEFHDPEIEAKFAVVREIAARFGALVTERIFAMDNNPNIGSPKTDQDRAKGIQPSTLRGIKEMNDGAIALSAAIDAFDRVSRDRIRVNIGSAIEAASEPDGREEKALEALNQLAVDAHRGSLPEIVSRPRVAVRLAPFAATEGKRLDAREVKALQKEFPPSDAQRIKADSDGTQWWSCEAPIKREGPNPETVWRLRLVRPGNFEYQATIGFRVDDDPQIMVDGRELEAIIIHNLERMGAMATQLGFKGPALASFYLDGVEDVELTQDKLGGRQIRKGEIVSAAIKIEDFSAPVAGTIREQFDILWQTAGWPDGSPSFPNDVWLGYGHG
jgi:hypothetical protein